MKSATKVNKNRRQELLEDLAKLSDWELRSFCLDESSCSVIRDVLDYKHRHKIK